MGLNLSKGNMYDFVTHTYNTIKGQCWHDCSYCYMKRFKLNSVRFDEKELKTDLGEGNFVFVGSGCDMFNVKIPGDWIRDTLNKCNWYDNKYLFQSKNPGRMIKWIEDEYINPDKVVLCATLETDRIYPTIMKRSPTPFERVINMAGTVINKYITIEPIMDFDLIPFVDMLKRCNPIQVNIGADSGNNNLPEPPGEKVKELIYQLEKFTKVKQKKDLNRLIEGAL